jgi:DNA helicase II / ATP-dependent DNA helicase PcrA
MDYLDKLNKEQREAAVFTEGPLLILAGAGSGKTSTMTHRIAYLIKEKKVNPQSILAVTFTNKAAKEMRERVEALVNPGMRMWILTFHSACLRMLRDNSPYIGFDKNFTVYDPNDQKAVMRGIFKELNIDDKVFNIQQVLGKISDSKEKGQNAKKFNEMYGYDFRDKIIGQMYTAYENILKKNNALDFDDLIMKTVELFENHKEVLEVYQDKFKYIMVDEYQDTNFLQYKFVKLLSDKSKNICVVGDDDQCIYQWRGADIKNILDFEKDFARAKVVKLEQNYRSHGNILEAAHSVIAHNKGRKQKKLWTDKEMGDKIKYYRAQDEKDEARYVINEIDRLKNKSRKYSDFAILYRTNAQSRNFEDALIAKDIPYRVLGGVRYYDRKEIKDIMCYMRLVQNPQDDNSLLRVINEPKRGMGDKTIEKLKALASVRNESLFSVLMDEEIVAGLSKKSSDSITEMVAVISELNKNQEDLLVSQIYESLIIRTGYVKALEEQKSVESDVRVENIAEFKSVIYDYEHENKQLTLPDFLAQVSLMADVDNHDSSENAVVLMTLHSAKGLEFPVVFIGGMEENLFPGWRSYEKPDGIEEERRLFYVGITRAMENLYLTGAVERTLYGRREITLESKFIKEINKDLLDEEGCKKQPANSYTMARQNKRDERAELFNPYKQLQYARESEKKRSEVRDSSEIKDGVRVKHTKFGEGLVISISEKGDTKTATIIFDSVGMKQLALDIAPLEVI